MTNISISTYLRELTNDNNTDYSPWKATKKINRPVMQIPPTGKQTGSGRGTMNKKHKDLPNTLNKYSNL